jgi:hypothetical protein
MMGGAFELLLTVLYRVAPVIYDGMWWEVAKRMKY